jgi:hypothetical protein
VHSAHTTHHTNPGKKLAPPLFLEDIGIFKHSARVVVSGIGYDAFENDHLLAKAQYEY